MSSDSGNLSDMAVKGTTVSEDAAKPRIIQSVPRPDQEAENDSLASADPQSAVDNATDMPRQHKDIGAFEEVVTGTGDSLPAEIESKNLHFDANNPLAEGHDRHAKHARQNESDLERYAGEGATADVPPGDEELSQDEVRDAKGI